MARGFLGLPWHQRRRPASIHLRWLLPPSFRVKHYPLHSANSFSSSSSPARTIPHARVPTRKHPSPVFVATTTRRYRQPSSSSFFSSSSFSSSSTSSPSLVNLTEDELDWLVATIPAERIRNFCVIAHVDHGKSTLSDRLLELTGNKYSERTSRGGEGKGGRGGGGGGVAAAAIPSDYHGSERDQRGEGYHDTSQPPGMDSLEVERERGITVKAVTASMLYYPPPPPPPPPPRGGEEAEEEMKGGVPFSSSSMPPAPYLLNLIDTPGHVDFSDEVRRSLGVCQGALLLVDSSQGPQAETLAKLREARELGLRIIPVMTKLDLPHADALNALEQLVAVVEDEERGLYDQDKNENNHSSNNGRVDDNNHEGGEGKGILSIEGADVLIDRALFTSAKTGEGLDDVLPAIVRFIPPPLAPLSPHTSAPSSSSSVQSSLPPLSRSLIFDAFHDPFRGVVCLVAVAGSWPSHFTSFPPLLLLLSFSHLSTFSSLSFSISSSSSFSSSSSSSLSSFPPHRSCSIVHSNYCIPRPRILL